jgi:hypothetical protein
MLFVAPADLGKDSGYRLGLSQFHVLDSLPDAFHALTVIQRLQQFLVRFRILNDQLRFPVYREYHRLTGLSHLLHEANGIAFEI